jgi:hypothetical protein
MGVLDFLWIENLVDVPVNVGSGKGTRLVDLAERISVFNRPWFHRAGG